MMYFINYNLILKTNMHVFIVFYLQTWATGYITDIYDTRRFVLVSLNLHGSVSEYKRNKTGR